MEAANGLDRGWLDGINHNNHSRKLAGDRYPQRSAGLFCRLFSSPTQRRDGDTVSLHQLHIANQGRMPFNDSHDALARQRLESLRPLQRQTVLRCMADDGLTHRVLAGALECCRDTKDPVQRKATRRIEQHLCNLWTSGRDGTRLVEHHSIDLFEPLERFASLDE